MYDIESAQLSAQTAAVVRDKVAVEDIPAWMEAAFAEIWGLMAQYGIQPVGPPFARYLLMDGVFEIEAGFPVVHAVEPLGRMEPSRLPGGSAATTIHLGPYETIPDAFEALTEWIEGHGYEEAGPAWEVYFTDPKTEPDVSKWRTLVVMPYRSPH